MAQQNICSPGIAPDEVPEKKGAKSGDGGKTGPGVPADSLWGLDDAGEPVCNIQEYALIGNLHTAASVSLLGSIESMCIPDFDSPSVFARILDANKGGHFFIRPVTQFKPKQQYAPNSNVLVSKFLAEDSVGAVTDLMPRRDREGKPFLPWLIRKVESIHGTVTFRMECAPAFNYCRDEHTAELMYDETSTSLEGKKVQFKSPDLDLDLRWTPGVFADDTTAPNIDVRVEKLKNRDLLGPAAVANFTLEEGQAVYFVLRQTGRGDNSNSNVPDLSSTKIKEVKAEVKTMLDQASVPRVAERVRTGAQMILYPENPVLSQDFLEQLIVETNKYWNQWIHKCKYRGRWRESVRRSALVLKMLVYEPTGAIVAAPTFSLPEYIGGTRNWDYRYCWIRDSSFTLYALIRLGFTEEATAYVNWILDRLRDRNSDGSLQIMYTIHGGKDIAEIELTHLEGHKGSKPVRIGNGAADHIQLDIYGELMDCIYLAQKFSAPLPWESWVLVRQVVDFVCTQVDEPDLSIWEVRGAKKNYTYSKVMMEKWITTRDQLYENIQKYAWNPERKIYGQSYEDNDHLDSAVLIMPLVFFISAADPRFTSTLDQILKTPEKGGLTINASIFRYNVHLSDDGVGGEEGAFSLCTLWGVEALTRAGVYQRKYLEMATRMFIQFLDYGNHVSLFSEEITFNLDRTLEQR